MRLHGGTRQLAMEGPRARDPRRLGRPATLRKLARALKVKPAELLSDGQRAE